MLVSVGAALVLGSVGAAVFRLVVPRPPPANVPVLMYHRIADDPGDYWSVAPRDFEAQLAFLKTNGFQTILPAELSAARRNTARLPPRPVMITFDDGDLTTLTAAEPLLRQYGFRAMAYLITDAVASLPAGRRLHEGHPCLVWSEVREMRSRGTFEFGGHSRHHVRLDQLSDPSAEVEGCFEDIRVNAGFEPDAFCYPFGVGSRKVARVVRHAGFSTAVTADEKVARWGWPSDAFRIPRLWVRGGQHVFQVRQVPSATAGESAFEISHEGLGIPVTGRLLGGQGGEWRNPEELGPGKRIWVFQASPTNPPATALSVEIWDRNRFYRLYPSMGGAEPVPEDRPAPSRAKARPLGALAVVAGLMALYGLVRPASVAGLSDRLDAFLKNRRWSMPIAILITSAILLFIELWRHYAFATSAFDLRVHEELVRQAWFPGGFMWSDLLGRSFLAHHVSFIFPLMAPIYWIWPNIIWLLLVQGVLVAVAAGFLWRLARGGGLRPMVAGTLALAFLGGRAFVYGYMQGFHQEMIAVCFLLGFLWAEQAGRYRTALLFALAALTCREDVAVSLLVYGLFVAVARPQEDSSKRRSGVLGLGLMFLCAAWLGLTYGWLMPHHAADGRMEAMERWSSSGGYGGIALDIIRHPWRMLQNLFNPGVLALFGSLLFLPLGSARAIFPILIPLIVLTSSSFPEQARLGGAYALLLLPYLFLGVVLTLARPLWRRLLANGRVAWVLCCLLLAFSLRDPRYPERMTGLPEAHRGVAETSCLPGLRRILAQGCILPHLGWSVPADMLGSPQAGARDRYDVILVGPDLDPWPLTRDAVIALESELAADGGWLRTDFGPVVCYRRSGKP